jgi:hypothetical protein
VVVQPGFTDAARFFIFLSFLHDTFVSTATGDLFHNHYNECPNSNSRHKGIHI